MSMAAILGALAFLVLGLMEVAVLQRVLYPALRWRHEEAKRTQSQRIEPKRIMTLLRFQSLVILPAIGFFLGDRLAAAFG